MRLTILEFLFLFYLLYCYTDGESFFLAAGHYQYPFNFQLPTGIPSSFEDDNGHIRYSIKVILDCPWAFNYETASHFIVNAIYDLNGISIASVRLIFTESRGSSAPISVVFSEVADIIC